MYTNIGQKIKIAAVVLGILGIVSSVVYGIIVAMRDDEIQIYFLGILIMILGSLLSWLCSMFLYGFGQLIENTDCLRFLGQQTSAANDVLLSADNYLYCPHCKRRLLFPAKQWSLLEITQCPYCNGALNRNVNSIDEIFSSESVAPATPIASTTTLTEKSDAQMPKALADVVKQAVQTELKKAVPTAVDPSMTAILMRTEGTNRVFAGDIAYWDDACNASQSANYIATLDKEGGCQVEIHR